MPNDSVKKVDRCFGDVAVFGNSVKRNIVLSTKSKQIERLCRKDEISRKTRSTLLPTEAT